MTIKSTRTKMACLTTAALLLASTTALAQTRYTYSVAGDEVTDTKTGLTWRRCSEGQTWSGSTCAGSIGFYTHEQALARAAAQAGEVGWRLPNVKELASISDKTSGPPFIDTTAFPATGFNKYWTSTPNSLPGVSGPAWLVDFFYNGLVRSDRRRESYLVRLVR